MTGEYRSCRICHEEFYVPQYKIKEGKGICCSNECRGKWRSKVFKEYPELNPFYIDGSTPERCKFYRTQEWIIVRDEVYKRDNYECQLCDSKKNIVAHHIIPREECFNPYDTSNLITLCHVCHFKVHHKKKEVEKSDFGIISKRQEQNLKIFPLVESPGKQIMTIYSRPISQTFSISVKH